MRTTRERARLHILSELLSFPTINQKDWISDSFCHEYQPGDLVSLVSAPASKWYVSWLREINHNNGWPKYLLESIDDGELCWWENVGLNVYSRERVSERPQWKWDDNQFAFADRWYRACKKPIQYSLVPLMPIFEDHAAVILNVRVRFNLLDYHNPRRFENYKKISIKDMQIYFADCLREYENYIPENGDVSV